MDPDNVAIRVALRSGVTPQYMIDNLGYTQEELDKAKEPEMPGIDLNQFATGADQIKPSEGGFTNPPDDTYEYEITNIGIHKGQKGQSIVIDYRLDNGQSKREWFGLPAVYGQETDKERQTLARYLRRLVDLGVPAETVNTFSDTDSLKGWTGVLELVTTKGKNGTDYQNVRNVRPSQAGSARPRDEGFIPAPTAPAAAPAAAAAPAVDQSNPFGNA